MKEKVLAVLITALIVSSIPCFAFAVSETDIPISDEKSLEYTHASTVSSTLIISDSGKAKPAAVIMGLPGGTTKLSVTMYLQRYLNGVWETVQKWSKSTTANHLSISKNKVVTKGRYRTHSVFKAYSNSKVERIEKNSKSVSY